MACRRGFATGSVALEETDVMVEARAAAIDELLAYASITAIYLHMPVTSIRKGE
jgi:hypothetical protein